MTTAYTLSLLQQYSWLNLELTTIFRLYIQQKQNTNSHIQLELGNLSQTLYEKVVGKLVSLHTQTNKFLGDGYHRKMLLNEMSQLTGS